MDSKVLVSILIIVFTAFAFITGAKLKDFPNTNCCKDINYPESTVCKNCTDYNFAEKVIYVWKFS